MYIASVKISNFRLFESFSLELNKGLNLLVGENDSGKTTLIDAIRLVVDTSSAEWVKIQESDFRSGTNTLSIMLKFDDLSPADTAVFLEHITIEKKDGIESKCVLYVTLNAYMEESTVQKIMSIKTEIHSGANSEGPLLDRDARSYLSATYLKPLRDAKNELSAGRSSRLSQILSSSKSIGGNNEDIDRLIKLIIEANTSIKSDTSLISSSTAIGDLIKSLIFKSDEFSPVIDIFASKNMDDMAEPEKRMVFKSIMEKLSLSLDDTIMSHGLGYSNLLFMSAELMLLKKEGEGFPLLLIEEPEAHLHPQLQMKFINFLRNQPNLQCILSTHSPNLASKAPLESLILMHQGYPFPLRKGFTALNNEDYVFLEKFLDVTKANMFFAKGVILVEGEGESILLPTIAELLGRPLEDYGVSVINLGGLTYKRYAKIYIANNKDDRGMPIKVACMTDLDLWPSHAEKKEGNRYGCIERKEKNSKKWLSYYSNSLDEYKSKKSELDKDNLKTFISDEWTFEYCLAKFGLAKEIYEAIPGNTKEYTNLSDNIDEKSLQIYTKIAANKLKTEVAYNMTELLSKYYKEKPLEFKKKLPPYIIKAIEHVTEPLTES